MTVEPGPGRAQEEIVARYDALVADPSADSLGWQREVLVQGLDFEHARPYLRDAAVAAEAWGPVDVEAAARGYLAFAVEKIAGHRGISAARSVVKLRTFAWLLGRDDVVEAMDAVGYPQYGAPKVLAFAHAMGWETDYPHTLELTLMAAGLPCREGCQDGCDR